jgi:hypothetical protein
MELLMELGTENSRNWRSFLGWLRRLSPKFYDTLGRCSPISRRDFAGDLPETKAKVLYAVQQPFHKGLLAGKTTNAAWRIKPSFYAVSTEDRTISPDLERFMAKRMGAKTIEVKARNQATSHSFLNPA